MRKKKRINIEDIIPEALYDAILAYHISSREEAVNGGRKIYNPYYFEPPIVISIDYIDKYNNIVYTEDNRYPRHVYSESELPFLQTAISYEEYLPFTIPYIRNEKIDILT